jgi:DNA end-binding protein Ku
VSALQAPGGRSLDRREVNMATQLVSALEDELDLSEFRDEYRDRVVELVQAKAEGKVVKFPDAPKREKEVSLEKMLAESLKAAKKRRASG